MKHYSTEMKKNIVTANIKDGRTISSLATEYGVSKASINNWIKIKKTKTYSKYSDNIVRDFIFLKEKDTHKLASSVVNIVSII